MAHCFTPIRGRRMRVTKVNALGRPVYGPATFVTTSGFVSVQFTPEIAEGEETEVRTASGELCSLPGTIVRVVDPATGALSELPIEKITTDHQVLTWAHSGHQGVLRRDGCAVTKVGRRDYDGDAVTISLASGSSSSCTQDHISLAMLGDAFDSRAAVFVLRRDDDYLIGYTSRQDGSRNSLVDALEYAREQQADGLWILNTYTSDAEAALAAAVAERDFSIPSLPFVRTGGIEVPLDIYWSKVGGNRLDAARCLVAFGRDVAYPLWDATRYGSDDVESWVREPLATRACNVMSGMLVCEVTDDAIDGGPKGTWRAATVTRQPYAGTVYSMDVAKDHSYVADNIVTMNCVSERGCDELRWITVQIEFCQVDPCLFTLINETWTELRDCVGDVIGWAESHKFSCDTGFGLELWTDVTGYTPTTPGAQGAWGYLLLPFIVGGTLGEQTVENGAISFTITGRTKKGSGWDVGPYDVMCNDATTGACGPLLTPVGPDEPRRIFLTTCPPPAAVCGCQPLSAPDGPPLTVVENDADATRMGVTASLPTGTVGTYSINWGDGSPVQDLVPGTPLNHTYVREGTYHVSAWDKTMTQKVTVQTVTVPFTGVQMPVITVTEAAGDPEHMTAAVRVNNHNNGPVTLQWGQTPPLPDGTNAGDNTAVTNQKYTENGSWTITAVDQNDPTLTSTAQVTVPFAAAPALTLTVVDDNPAAASPRRTARATWDNQGQGTVKLFWGDEPADPPPTGVDKPDSGTDTHTYQPASDGQVTVRVVDANTPARSQQQTVTIPDFPPAVGTASEPAAIEESPATDVEPPPLAGEPTGTVDETTPKRGK